MESDPQTSKNLSLDPIGEHPYVGETPQIALGRWLTPNPLFYVRSQFEYPELDVNSWRLQVSDSNGNKICFSLEEIKQLPKHTLPITLECAGNNRADLDPVAPGNQFNNGAVSNAVWSGTTLKSLLEDVDLDDDVVEILFEGADVGSPADGKDPEPYLRSISLELARHDDTMLAYEMNGEDLPLEHGYPIRLLVPGWYGMAHVKWLTKITALTKPFFGYFQGEKYVLKYKDGTEKPVQEMQVKSSITSPNENETLKCGTVYHVKGHAWSGRTNLAKVEVSVDDGNSWNMAQLTGPSEQYSWQQWSYRWRPDTVGQHIILSRATNVDGLQQPLESVWNELGYQVNGIKSISVHVAEQ